MILHIIFCLSFVTGYIQPAVPRPTNPAALPGGAGVSDPLTRQAQAREFSEKYGLILSEPYKMYGTPTASDLTAFAYVRNLPGSMPPAPEGTDRRLEF